MKKIILILSLVIINIACLFSQPIKGYTKEELTRYSKTNLQKIRDVRFIYIPKYSYKEDTDLEVVGDYYLNQSKISIKKDWKKIIIQESRQKQTNKFKSTYLNFTILTEENIS